MKNEFLNKNIFISGGSNGIGYEIAKHFLKKKANIFILGRKNNFKKSKKLNFYRFDVLKKKELNLLIDKIKNKYFDIVVHSLGGSLKLNSHLKLNEANDVWLLNAGIPIYLNEFFIKQMKKKKIGRIIHISSASTENLNGRLPYICSKTYLNTYIKKKSIEISKSNILLNGILPGAIEAYKNNLKLFLNNNKRRKKFIKKNLNVNKVGTINSLIPLIEFMVSKKNDYMVGELIKIDGGEK